MTSLKTFLLILFIVALNACSYNRYPRLLIVADSIADDEPKKALAMLDSMKPQMSEVGEAVKNYYLLLRIKAADKAYITHTSDTAILRLVDYYENDGDKTLLPITYYYAGRVYRDLQDAPQALDFFRKAEDAIKDCGSEDTKFLAYIYGQIGYILNYQGFYKEAQDNFFKAYSINLTYKNIQNQIYNLRDIGGVYWNLEKLDSALFYYKQAKELAVGMNNSRIVADISEQMASIYKYMGKTDEAWNILRKASVGSDSINLSSTLSIYSDLYIKRGLVDSAVVCYKKLLKYGNIYGLQGAYEGLARYYLGLGMKKEANVYFDKYILITDSIKKINASEAIANSLSMYNYRIRERDNYELKIRLQEEKEQKIIILSLFILSVVILSSGILWYRHKNKLIRLEKEKAELAEQNRLLEELRLMEDKELRVKNSEIYKLIQGKISDYSRKHEVLTDDEWIELNNLVNEVYENFELKVHDYVPGISLQDYKTCLLIKIKIRPTYIAYITNHSKESINSARRRLYKKAFGITATPADWDKLINSL